MLTPREIRREERKLQATYDRFKRGYYDRLMVGILLSVTLHYALFAYSQPIGIANLGAVKEELDAVHLPPEVRIPAPPVAIARPAVPRISARPVSDDLTIALTTFDENPVESLAPPSPGEVDDVRARPVYVARDVEPRLLNTEEIRAFLKQLYPPQLREVGIGGRVVLWVFVEPNGSSGVCQIHKSSGYAPLDRKAEEIAARMRFSPATCRDRPVGVWIAQPIDLQVRGGV